MATISSCRNLFDQLEAELRQPRPYRLVVSSILRLRWTGGQHP
jgi:hypothetical protein